MTKRVSSRVIKTCPFVERRIRNNPLKNKYHRAGDIPPANIWDSLAINSATYEVSSGRAGASNNNNPTGQVLDYYAWILARQIEVIANLLSNFLGNSSIEMRLPHLALWWWTPRAGYHLLQLLRLNFWAYCFDLKQKKRWGVNDWGGETAFQVSSPSLQNPFRWNSDLPWPSL